MCYDDRIKALWYTRLTFSVSTLVIAISKPHRVPSWSICVVGRTATSLRCIDIFLVYQRLEIFIGEHTLCPKVFLGQFSVIGFGACSV